jgi:plasmid stability protein
LAVKQVFLRVPDGLHRRLAARAGREGRSVNSLATEILDAAADADQGNRQARLRARAAAGILRETKATPVDPARRRQVVASTKGLGPVLDRILDDERNRP